MSKMRILVTGANGYIGGRLIYELAKMKSDVCIRSMVRRPEQFKASCKIKHEICFGDALNKASLEPVFKDVDIVFYLIHSLARPKDFEDAEHICVSNIIEVAKKNNVKKIIYLGGLIEPGAHLSRHLKSRQNVGQLIRESGIPSITFRASIIIGSGSISFEMIRSLTERLPVMITPKWVQMKSQPISIRDVLAYLTEAIFYEVETYEIFEIGGSNQVSYAEIMKEYAKQRQLSRIIIPIPVFSTYLSSLWLSLFTPIYAKVGMRLINSIKNATVVNNAENTKKVFAIKPMSCSQAIAITMAAEKKVFNKTHWATAYSASDVRQEWLEEQQGNKLIYVKKCHIYASITDSFECVQQIGANKGWYYATWLWKIRGYIDLMVGGPGHKRGRRHPEELHEGDFVDWWRVEQLKVPCILRLKAEMKLPGHAWLEFEYKKKSATACDLYVSAIFDPSGVMGRLYWYMLYPIHFFMFNGLVKKLKRMAEKG